MMAPFYFKGQAGGPDAVGPTSVQRYRSGQGRSGSMRFESEDRVFKSLLRSPINFPARSPFLFLCRLFFFPGPSPSARGVSESWPRLTRMPGLGLRPSSVRTPYFLNVVPLHPNLLP